MTRGLCVFVHLRLDWNEFRNTSDYFVLRSEGGGFSNQDCVNAASHETWFDCNSFVAQTRQLPSRSGGVPECRGCAGAFKL